ncbi:DUF6503 family protein [Flavobacterium sandaracinum]|uniref:Deoxyribose-phosphate aldolase n=1 Tax=Flavobacterium sandaracinum TaxID=2541733 RepID=A0A4V2Z1E3_9FLAO|nr:DUF6503 family protein [Flavobacterium sandaracinum]TDE04428.1 hypothetical protein E0F91_08950 [Flavobacterium sandaracinum]
MKKNLLTLCVLAALSLCCNKKKDSNEAAVNKDTLASEKQFSKADSIITRAIKAHGGNLYNSADYSFLFREKKYRFQNNGANFQYTSEIQKGDSLIKDILTPEKFERYINGKLQPLNKEDSAKYSEALNSVIYFAALPYKLQDASVNKGFIEEVTIKGQQYDAIGVTFGQDGGGKDFDDEYQYWINKETHKMDYLAYNYRVNNGGVRFRVAFNTRVIDGVSFQDYINYQAPLQTPLKDLPKLYEQGKLKEVSQILTENVVNNHK